MGDGPQNRFARAMTVGGRAPAKQAERSPQTLLAVSENYPELENQNFLALQEGWPPPRMNGLARQYYNDSVKEYNIAISVFPNNLLSAGARVRAPPPLGRGSASGGTPKASPSVREVFKMAATSVDHNEAQRNTFHRNGSCSALRRLGGSGGAATGFGPSNRPGGGGGILPHYLAVRRLHDLASSGAGDIHGSPSSGTWWKSLPSPEGFPCRRYYIIDDAAERLRHGRNPRPQA